MQSISLELTSANIGFSSETLLKDVNLRIHRSETFVLVGPSGQGKSTLLKTLAGLVQPLAGELRIEGVNFLAASRSEKQKLILKMGMLFQKNALFDSLTVRENIAFPLREVTPLGEDVIQERVRKYLEMVGLSHAIDLFPDEISGGMQKRVGIARALALEPEIIFYDDPTAGLDPITSRKIIDLIIELKKKSNATVVAITNEMNRAYQMANRIALVAGGQIIETGDVESTKRHSDPWVQQFINGKTVGPLTGHS